jgi:hypothetical protein
VEERRRGEDRRKLRGPFLAMLALALPEDRRKGERRHHDGSPEHRADGDERPWT